MIELNNTGIAELDDTRRRRTAGLSTRISTVGAESPLTRAIDTLSTCAHHSSGSGDQRAIGDPRALKRTLVGTHGSRCAANAVVRAAMLAAEHSAELEIVRVTSRSNTEQFSSREEWQAGVMALLRPYDVNAAFKLLVGDPATTLAIEATRFGADLIVVGRRKKRSFRDALIGTTSERLLKRWPGDTLVVGKAPASRYAMIIMPSLSFQRSLSASFSRDSECVRLHTFTIRAANRRAREPLQHSLMLNRACR